MNRRKKSRFRRRILSIATALAMVISSMAVPQGEAVADTGDGIIVQVDTQSPYVATQIVNGDFESDVWESYVLQDGITYTSKPNSKESKTILKAIPNGVGMGWNTTENKTYQGSLFEVWPLNNLPAETNRTFPETNEKYFIEMNANNPAALYQDLATQGGDVIKWTLQHAARTGLGFKEQRMYVTIGNPKREANGAITPATGVSNNIDTKIEETGKAEYRYSNENQEFQITGTTAYANPNELKGLSVLKTDSNWHDVAGIYIVPEGQEVTRFAFCADSESKQAGDKDNELSGGNFLDNITFSTLIGNVKANKQTNNNVEITGYWGDEGNKSLIVEYTKNGDTEATKQTINMSTVKNQNFKITVPESMIGGATSVKVYHQDYPTAVRDIPIKHAHTLSYAATGNKLSVSCANQEDPCLGEENKKEITLNVSEAEYTGIPYTGAALDNTQKTAWITAGLDVPRIWYEKLEGGTYVTSNTAPTDVGTYRANITAGGVTATAAFNITPKPITDSAINVAITSPEYDGTSKTVAITVKDGSKVLTKGTDYELSGSLTGIGVGSYTATITGKGNYKDSVNKTWTIQKGTMSDPVPNNYSGVYDGAEHSASVSVATPAGATVTYCGSEGGKYQENAPSYTDVGEHIIYYKITKENYNDKSGTLKVTITPKSIAADWFTISSDSYKYDGTIKAPEITVKDGGKVLVKDTDYTVSGNTTGSSLGEYAVEIIGQGNYTGTVLKTWQIAEGDMSALKKEEYNATYDGEAHSSTVRVDSPADAQITYCETENGTYTETPPTYTDVGTYPVYYKIEKVGYITQTGTLTVAISPKSLDAVASSIDPDSYVYDGGEKTPVITVTDGERTLQKDVDYKLSGTLTASQVSGEDGYVITVEGLGNYEGTITKTWKITKGVMTDLQENNYEGVYDGAAHSATVTVGTPEDATITYCETENGTYTAAAPSYTDVGNYAIYYRIEKEGYETLTGTLTVSISSKPQHRIIFENDSHGTASASVEGAVVTTAESGKEVTLTAAPDSGYKFKKWTVSQGEITIENNKFIMPDTDVIIKAEFEVTQSESGGGSESGGTGIGESGSSGSGIGGTGSGSSGSGSGSSGSNPSTSTPDSSENASENFVIPVKNENTVKVEAEIKSGTAKVSEITTDTIDKVVENREQESKVDTITIDLSGAKQEITGVTLSKKSVETLAKATADGDNGIETATIELSKATVVLDNKTLETLVADAKGILIELVVTDKEQKLLNTVQQTSLNQHEVATTFEAYFTSDGERIHDFKGGKAVVSIDFTPEAGKDTSFYHMVYVPEDGSLFRYKTKYENGKLMFTTTHFSDYAVIYDTNEKNMTEEPAEGEEKKDSDTSADTDLDKDTGEKSDAKVTMDTTYSRLRLRIPKSTRTTNVLKWTRESGADGYVIYGNKCNTSTQTYKMVQKIVIPNGATTTWTDTKLKKSTYYKYYIKAYKLVDGKKVWLAKSKVVHSTTTGGRYGNAKAVKVNKTAVSLAVGKTFTIRAEQILKDLPILKHTEIQFESSNSKAASVNRKGIIQAKKKGTCTIYVYAQNGIYKKLKVTVK